MSDIISHSGSETRCRQKRSICIRVDASPGIGLGHVMRCLTLAEALINAGFYIRFICLYLSDELHKNLLSISCDVSIIKDAQYKTFNKERDIEKTLVAIRDRVWDCMIVDHYDVDHEWESTARSACHQLMVIDDLANRQHDCDILLDQTLDRSSKEYQAFVPEHCELLTGAQYALLKPTFYEARSYKISNNEKIINKKRIDKLLISLGGADQTQTIVQVLKGIKQSNLSLECHITVIAGYSNIDAINVIAETLTQKITLLQTTTNMADVLIDSDLVIGAAGTSTWERCCLGIPTIMLVLADNQFAIAQSMLKHKACLLIESLDCLDNSLKSAVNELADNPEKRLAISRAAYEVTEGLGVFYIKALFEKKLIPAAGSKLIKKALIRPICVKDSGMLMSWRNHPNIRQHMFNKSIISQEEHEIWFNSAQADPLKHALIFEWDGKPSGFCSFDQVDDEAEWGFYLSPDVDRQLPLNKGIGSALGQAAINYGFIQLKLKKIVAQVIETNVASCTFHKRLGFEQEKILKDHYGYLNQRYSVYCYSLKKSIWDKKYSQIGSIVTGEEALWSISPRTPV